MPIDERGVDVEDLRKELNDIETRSSRGPFFTCAEGRNVVRVLPTWAAGKKFFYKVYGHWVNAKRASYPCLNKMKGQKCYLCEVVEDLREAGDRKRANQLASSVRYFMQIIDRKNPDAGVQVFNAGSTIFKGIGLLLDDPDWKDLLDLEKGSDVVIDRTGQGLDTDYPSTRPRKDPSPAGVTKGDLLDLEKIVTWSTYEEMKEMYEEISGTAPAAEVVGTEAQGKAETKTEQAKKENPECYGKYNADAQKCKECTVNFDCEIDTPAA